MRSVYIIKRIKILMYNKKNNTKIHSVKANLNAKYGKEVLISKGTFIDNNVTIGDYSYINNNSYIENCDIGKFCSISSGVYICPYEHDYTIISTHPIMQKKKSNNFRKKVNIGNDVLISLNAIILEGVNIGDGAVIGAGAVVTRDIKPYEIVGGIPAKHIKYRFDEKKIKDLLTIKWWNWDMKEIKDSLKNLENGHFK